MKKITLKVRYLNVNSSRKAMQVALRLDQSPGEMAFRFHRAGGW